MPSPERHVLVLIAKRPRTGRAKRRLAATLGPAPARVMARAFLIDTLALMTRVASRRLIAFAPRTAAAWFARLDASAILVPQPRASFGTRLRAALAAGLAAGERAVVIGMDSPTLPQGTLRRAFRALERAQCVLGPARDGGYYLIGARQVLPPSLFSAMPWSTAGVLRETLARARAAGLSVALLPIWYDVDDAAGLSRLRRDARGLRRAVATRAALRAMGLLR
jgi:rSAM/selenodomain-associated transferase 1